MNELIISNKAVSRICFRKFTNSLTDNNKNIKSQVQVLKQEYEALCKEHDELKIHMDTCRELNELKTSITIQKQKNQELKNEMQEYEWVL